MGLFKKEENQEPVIEKKKSWKFSEEYSFSPPSCHGKLMTVRAFNDNRDSYVFQCEECGRVSEGEISEE